MTETAKRAWFTKARPEAKAQGDALIFCPDQHPVPAIPVVAQLLQEAFSQPHCHSTTLICLMRVNGMNNDTRHCAEFDRNVLTALLSAVSDTPLKAASDILERFSTFQHATRADHDALSKIIGDDGANLLKTIPQAVTSMTRETAAQSGSYLLTLEAAKTHLSALLNGRRVETFAVLYLSSKNRLLGEDLLKGTLDRIHIYPREIVRRAMTLDASVALIAHNHPSGDPTPSEADIKLTRKLERALDVVDVILLNHLIFAAGPPFSFIENGVL